MMNNSRNFEPLNLMPYTRIVYKDDIPFLETDESELLSAVYQVVYDVRTGEELHVYLTREFFDIFLDTALELGKTASNEKYRLSKEVTTGPDKPRGVFEL